MATRKNLQRKENRNAQRLSGVRRGYAKAAEIIGVASLVDDLPRVVKNRLLDLPYMDPTVIPDQASAGRASAAPIRAALLERLREASFELDDGASYPIRDFFSYALALCNAFKAVRARSKEPEHQQPATRAMPLVESFLSRRTEDALAAVWSAMRQGAADFTRIQTELVSWMLLRQEIPPLRHRFTVIFTLTDPQARDFCINGQFREAFRSGNHRGPPAPVEWVSWPSATLGLPGQQGEFPVYVQSHALRRIDERLKELGSSAAHFWLWESLRKPNVIRSEGDCHLVEYRFFENRLGYLRARRVGDAIVVTTFIFLTMAGTPEADRLHQALRLQRSDVAYQHLDMLGTFTNTDVLDDPVLMDVFRHCGCAHLADLRQRLGHQAQPYAAELRKYLRLDEHQRRQALAQRIGLANFMLDGSTAGEEAT